MSRSYFLIGGLLLLAGCGSDEGTSNEIEQSTEVKPSSSGMDVAAAPAIEEPKVDCSSVKGQTAPAGQPADDILGVRQGMSLEQTRNVLLCKNKSFAIDTSNSSKTIPNGGVMPFIELTANSGLEMVDVWLVGPPGKEQVVHVMHQVEYTKGNELPVATIHQKLVNKYGEFDESRYGNEGYIVRSRDGQRLDNRNSNYSTCRRSNIDTDSPTPCLSVVQYEIGATNENPELTARWAVMITSHAKTWAMAQAAEQQQARDVEKARQAAEENGVEL